MLSIIVSACSLANPYQCKDYKIPLDTDQMTPYECMFKGQLEIAKWKETHPNVSIAKWKCTSKPEENL